jgi:hypothetical protein
MTSPSACRPASARTSGAAAGPTCGALEAAGAAEVAVAGECSICNPDRYFSHRRDRGVTGRQGVVGVLDG